MDPPEFAAESRKDASVFSGFLVPGIVSFREGVEGGLEEVAGIVRGLEGGHLAFRERLQARPESGFLEGAGVELGPEWGAVQNMLEAQDDWSSVGLETARAPLMSFQRKYERLDRDQG